MTPRENCYISGYEGPNEIYQDFLERKQTVISLLEVLDPEDETMTCGSSYNFSILNSPVIGHLWKIYHKSQLVKPIMIKSMVSE